MSLSIAERLKEARTSLNLTLETVFERTGIAASALSDFENAKREPRLGQLKQLAETYRRSLTAFLDDAPFPRQVVLWRERPSSPRAEELEAKLIELAERYHALEALCGQHSPMELPVPKDINKTFDYQAAQSLARRVRTELGLGDRPGHTLLRVLEEVCNVKVFHLSFEPTGSAACSMSEQFGAAVLLNANSVRWRRNFDLAHELFHLLTWKQFRHDIGSGTEVASDDEERLATCFARNLLMPEEIFREAINSQRGLERKVGFDGLFEVAREFDVSIEAVLWQMVFVFNTPVDRIKDAVELLSDTVSFRDARESDSPPIRPVRFVALCNRAIRKGVISTGRYADYLGISRREAMKHVERDPIADVEVEVAHS
jgi:Zn-dependent peptidase ImmA (M78 family)